MGGQAQGRAGHLHDGPHGSDPCAADHGEAEQAFGPDHPHGHGPMVGDLGQQGDHAGGRKIHMVHPRPGDDEDLRHGERDGLQVRQQRGSEVAREDREQLIRRQEWGRRWHRDLPCAVGHLRCARCRRLPLYPAAGACTVRYRTERPRERGYPSSRVNSSRTTW